MVIITLKNNWTSRAMSCSKKVNQLTYTCVASVSAWNSAERLEQIETIVLGSEAWKSGAMMIFKAVIIFLIATNYIIMLFVLQKWRQFLYPVISEIGRHMSINNDSPACTTKEATYVLINNVSLARRSYQN